MSDVKMSPEFWVRKEDQFLAASAPPRSEGGLISWMRKNLFETWTDRIITALIVVLGAWFFWSSFSNLVLRANVEGVTQGEGTLARVVSELDAQLDEAQHMSDKAEKNGDRLVAEMQAELATLRRKIELVDPQQMETTKRLGQTKRVISSKLNDRITIAQSKLPLSAVIRLEAVRRELENPLLDSLPNLDGITLNAAEQATLKLNTAPWTRTDETNKKLFQSTYAAAKKALFKTAAGDNGKQFLPLDEALAAVEPILADLDATTIMERPTRPALQFNSIIDGVAAAPITTIPLSRIQKIRKDTVSADTIAALRTAAAKELVDPTLTGLRARKALANAEKELNDAKLFLQREMPGDTKDPLPKSLIAALDEVEFWNVGEIVANPAVEAPTTFEKAPAVLQALRDANATGPYADASLAMMEAYAAQDIDGMRQALEPLAPITHWAEKRNGANWAVIAQNWKRMLWGTFPPEKLWRVGAVLLGLFVALLPMVVPACRKAPFFLFSAVYPLLVLFFLSGLSFRLYGFDLITNKGLGALLYSEMGRVIQAAIMILLVVTCWAALRFTKFGVLARPALIVTQILAVFYFVIMIWGTVINPPAAEKNLLVETNFKGLLTADHPLGDRIDPSRVQEEIDALIAQSENPDLSADEAQALRVEAVKKRPELAAAASAKRDFVNVVKQGEGTVVILPHVPSSSWGGLLVTMVLGIIGMAASLPIGIVLAFGRQSTLPVVKYFSTGLIEIIRGVPLIALLLIVTFVLPKLLPAGADYPKLGLVLLAICLFGGVYQAEVIRGGLQSLPKGQYEAAQSMGLNFWQESRLITLPQALKAVIPAIVNTFIGLFKDTTLVIVVGIFDLLTITQAQILSENAWNTTQIEALLVVSLIFFVLMFGLSRYSMWLEGRLATGHR